MQLAILYEAFSEVIRDEEYSTNYNPFSKNAFFFMTLGRGCSSFTICQYLSELDSYRDLRLADPQYLVVRFKSMVS